MRATVEKRANIWKIIAYSIFNQPMVILLSI